MVVQLILSPSPDYKLLGILKRQFPNVPLLGLTATATSSVLKDCQKILCVPQPLTITASFNRTNLYYEVSSSCGYNRGQQHINTAAVLCLRCTQDTRQFPALS